MYKKYISRTFRLIESAVRRFIGRQEPDIGRHSNISVVRSQISVVISIYRSSAAKYRSLAAKYRSLAAKYRPFIDQLNQSAFWTVICPKNFFHFLGLLPVNAGQYPK
ncbi:hypothetical protein [Peribacillus tepidiphilus]|uniref:hypothetical protein n=1 Tax=Peribacillus tepidiphilus TaxID=2652445 RepID=UPI001291130C|nr:hypothetical protein [Peribacillus tepidiphilus]